ncbi:Glucosyl transferase [Balamuthia mandrillaris]
MARSPSSNLGWAALFLLLGLICSWSAHTDATETNSAPPQTSKPTFPQGYLASRAPSSFSVIVPAHNTAPYITETLESIDASINEFQNLTASARKIKAEVVIVDDASTDNTAARVMSFIRKKGAQRVTNPKWKLIGVRDQLLAGAARNLGVLHSTGDVLFFLDSDDLFHPQHISQCFVTLLRRWQTIAMVQTQAHIELPGLHPEWKPRIESTLPHNRCILRKLHEFVEGFPEQGVFNRHNDVGYIVGLQMLQIPLAKVDQETITYKIYPGNSLDKQRNVFLKHPSEAPISEEEKTPEFAVRVSNLWNHVHHLQRKLEALVEGRELKEDPFWAIYSYTARALNIKDWSFLNTKLIRYQRLVQFAEHQMNAGKTNDAKRAFGVAPKFLFNHTEPVDNWGKKENKTTRQRHLLSMAFMDEEVVRRVFEEVDTNGDGLISLSEFATAAIQLNMSEQEANFTFKVVDLNKDGVIDLSEFKRFLGMAVEEEAPPLHEDGLQALFNAFDTDGNGFLDKEEIKQAFQVWGEQVSDEQLDQEWPTIDLDGDGVINFEEFKLMILNKK